MRAADSSGRRNRPLRLMVSTQLPAGGAIDEPTKEKVELALEPRVVMAAMHTTTIRASITAYSTAVGPSSAFRNDTRLLVRLRIGLNLEEKPGESGASR